MAKLTTKQRKFIAAYDGNGVAAARAAGYTGNAKTLNAMARQNLSKPGFQKALNERLDKAENALIASREERQQFWTSALRGMFPDVDRLRSSELLGKSEGDFVEKSELNIVAKIEVVTPYPGKR